MGTFDINIDKLNEAVILAGSRTQLASDLGTAPSYITHMINNGTVELDKAQIIKDRYGVDITQGYKLNLKQYAPKKSVPTYEKDAFGRFDAYTGELLEIYDSKNRCPFFNVGRVLSGDWSHIHLYDFKYLRDCKPDELHIDTTIDESLPLVAFNGESVVNFSDYANLYDHIQRKHGDGYIESVVRQILRGYSKHDELENLYHQWKWFGYKKDAPDLSEYKHYEYIAGGGYVKPLETETNSSSDTSENKDISKNDIDPSSKIGKKVMDWLIQCCSFDTDEITSTRNLYLSYRSFYNLTYRSNDGKKRLVEQLESLDFIKSEYHLSDNGITEKFFRGIGIKDISSINLREGQKLSFIKEGQEKSEDFGDYSNILNELYLLKSLTENLQSEVIFLQEQLTETRNLIIKNSIRNEQEKDIELMKSNSRIVNDYRKRIGRRPITVDSFVFDEAYQLYIKRELNKKQFAEILNITVPTLNRILKEREVET